MCTILFSLAASAEGFEEARPKRLEEAKGKGVAALELARDAWSRGELQEAEARFAEALSRGGLKRDQTLECHVRLGAARAVLGKKDAAQSAFRAAALIDASFAVPSDAGKKAVQLADTVRKQQTGFGQLALALDLPKSPRASAPIAVTVTMDSAHTTLFARVSLTAREGSSGRSFAFELTPAEAMHFTVPASLALPGGDVALRVQALDANDNELAASEGHVRLPAPEKTAEPAPKPASGGFWASPWPYLVGGAILAGAAAGVTGVVFATQTPSQVNVGTPTVRPGG